MDTNWPHRRVPLHLQDYVKLLRTRWVTVLIVALLTVGAALAYSLLTKPVYQASTRLYVSTSAGVSATDMYQGNRLSQDRVLSYTELLMGQTIAQRTIDKLGLDMSSADLKQNVSATAKANTVLITVKVLDRSPLRARDIANVLSDEFVAMVRELETPPTGAPPDARVVVEQRASVPERPVIPNTKRNLAIGIGLGLLLGVAAALLRDLMDNTVKTREVAEELSGAGLVGTIPLDKARRKEPAITFASDNSAIAESFRQLRTNLQFLSVDNPPRVIVVTSSVPHEGKSTTAINIALALAEAGHSILLIDGDMRRPVLHKYLDLIGNVGFSTVLSGSASRSEALQKTRFPGLTVLTAGAIPPNPSELLASQTAQTLLTELREEFDYIIVDSSPLLAVTDAAILAAGTDGVLMMARFGATKRDQFSHAVKSIADVGRKPLGVVFTMTPTRGDNSYGYKYRYYGSEETHEEGATGLEALVPEDASSRTPEHRRQ